MTPLFDRAIAVNKIRSNFLGWCADGQFPDAHIKAAWDFVDTVTRDLDLWVSDAVLNECVERAQQQLEDISHHSHLSLELSTAALTGNFGTLTEVVLQDKVPETSESQKLSLRACRRNCWRQPNTIRQYRAAH